MIDFEQAVHELYRQKVSDGTVATDNPMLGKVGIAFQDALQITKEDAEEVRRVRVLAVRRAVNFAGHFDPGFKLIGQGHPVQLSLFG